MSNICRPLCDKYLLPVAETLGQKIDSCVQVSEVKKIRVGRSKNIFILDFFFYSQVQRLQ